VKPDPDPGTGDFVDVSVINANMAKVDDAVGAFVCTSVTRPSSPWDGQIIREADTTRLAVWSSGLSAWQTINAPDTATSSARPGAPYINSLVRESDTRKLIIWNNPVGVWDYVGDGLTICTSSTRPANPYFGQLIRETNTKRIYVWTPSSAWELVSDPDLTAAQLQVRLDSCRLTGIGAYQTTSTDPSEIVNIRSASLNLVNGKSYRFSGQMMYVTPTDGWTMEIHKNSTAGTMVGGWRLDLSTIGATVAWDVTWPCTANESGVQFYYVANRLSGTGTLTCYNNQDGFNSTYANIDIVGSSSGVQRDVA